MSLEDKNKGKSAYGVPHSKNQKETDNNKIISSA